MSSSSSLESNEYYHVQLVFESCPAYTLGTTMLGAAAADWGWAFCIFPARAPGLRHPLLNHHRLLRARGP